MIKNEKQTLEKKSTVKNTANKKTAESVTSVEVERKQSVLL